MLEPYTAPTEFDHQGERVVEGQRLTQAANDEEDFATLERADADGRITVELGARGRSRRWTSRELSQ